MFDLFKRTVCALLVFAMVFSMAPQGFADSPQETPTQSVEESVPDDEAATEAPAPQAETEEPEQPTPYTMEGEPVPASEDGDVENTEDGEEETDPVFDPDDLVRLTIVTLPGLLQYQVGDELDLTGLTLCAEDANGLTQILGAEDVKVSFGSTDAAGITQVTVSYGEQEVSFSVTVHNEMVIGEVLRPAEDYPESAHNYANNCDESYVYTCPGAQSLRLVFSESTCVENTYDYIYIYDGEDTQLGKYTGTNLAGQEITVTGNTVTIRLTSDGSSTKYGFSLDAIYATMPIPTHESAEDGVETPAGCFADGFTTYTCDICGEEYVVTHPDTAAHSYADGFCTRCGLPESTTAFGWLTDTILWAVTEELTLYILGSGEMPDSISWDSAACTAQTLVVGDGITAIGSSAFQYFSALTTVSLPNSLKTLGERAFYGCSKLEAITIPSGITQLPKYCFYNCTKLAEVNLPDSLTTLGDNAFYRCSALATITIPAGVTEVSQYCFYNCTKLETVDLPDSLKTLGDNAFYGCTGLKSITIPSGVTEVPQYCFGGCTSLTQVTLQEGLTTIAAHVFDGCNKLAEITFPDSLTTVDGYAFRNCTALETLTLPEGLTTLGSSCFYNCTKLTSVALPSGLTQLGDYCFYACAALTSITIPDGVTELKQSTFYNCKALAEVTLPEGLTTIAAHGFDGCNKLAEITFPDSLTTIDDYAFRNCSALETLTLPEGLKTLGSSCFYGCKKLTGIALPSGLTQLESYSFYGCATLTSITIPAGVTSIPYDCFYNCTKLTEVTLPEGLTSISSYAFNRCSALTSISLPDSLTTLYNYAFQGCTALESVTIPANITGIPYSCFDGCTSLAEVNLPEGLTSIGSNAFYNCYALTQVNLPENIQINSYAFCDCTALETLVIPAGASVYTNAFGNCTKLESLTIGDNATIKANAFYNCTGLKNLTLGSNVTVETGAFSGVVVSDTLDNGVTWSLDMGSGVLSFSGGSTIPDFTTDAPAPWSGMKDMILEVELSNITTVGSNAFAGLENLSYLIFPDGLSNIATGAFRDCGSLTYVELPDGVQSIGSSAFAGCDNLEEVVFLGDAPATLDTDCFGSAELTVQYPETGSGFIQRIFDKFLQYIWKKWDNTVPTRDVVLLLDVSCSMYGKEQQLSDAATQLVNAIGGATRRTRISLVTYASYASTLSGLTTNTYALDRKLATLSANGGTSYTNALARATEILSTSTADMKFVIMFSDGEPNDDTDDIYPKAQAMRDSGIQVYTVGLLSSDNQRQVLINVAGDASRYFEAADIAALIAAFQELSENFGKSEYTTAELKFNERRYNILSENLTLSLASDTKISIYLTPGINEMYDNVANYALEQNGKYVLSSTTGNFENFRPGDYFQYDGDVYLVLLDSQGNVIERKRLLLTFGEDYSITYNLGTDYGSRVYMVDTFVPGSDMEEPVEPSRIGYTFQGWYASEKCEGIEFFRELNRSNRMSLNASITLYAKWQKKDTQLILGTDSWTFGNSRSEFKSDHYEMTVNDLIRLKSDWQDEVTRAQIDDAQQRDWGGSCFGMSSSVVLAKNGDIDIYDFPANGTSGTRYSTIGSARMTYNTRGDSDVGSIESMINFYHIRQILGYINTVRTDYTPHYDGTDSQNLARIINKMKQADEPVLMTITLWNSNSNYGGHAVVSYDLEETADGYSFKVYDCSQFGSANHPIYFVVDVTVENGVYTASCESWENAWNNSGYAHIFFKTALTVDELKTLSILTAPNTLNTRAASGDYTSDAYSLTTNYGSFTISDGVQSATIADGMYDSGDLEIICYGLVNDVGAEKEYLYQLPVLEEGTGYTITQSGSGGRTVLYYNDEADGFYTTHTAAASGSITIGSTGSIQTQYSAGVLQTAKIATNNPATPWYTVAVSGTSTGLTLAPTENGIQVKSDSDTTVEITAKSDFNDLTLTDVALTKEQEVTVEESEGRCVVVQEDEIIAGDTYGYSVAFNSQLGSNVETLTNVPYGKLIEAPSDPTKVGCIFEGWFKDADCTVAWDFAVDTVTADTILYAGWSVNPNYLQGVTFRVPGREDQIIYLPKGGLVSESFAPTDDNGVPLEWYTDAAYRNPWDFETDTIKGDTVLYGKTTQCTVSFVTDCEQELDDVTSYVGMALTQPEGLTREGYTLCGWYTDDDFENSWDFDTDLLTGDMTLYAKWVANQVDKNGEDTGICIEILGSYTYTGKAIKPTVVVRDNGTILKLNTDYTLSYKNNINACDPETTTAKSSKWPSVIVQGKGNYKSAKKIMVYFAIGKADLADLKITLPTLVKAKSGNKSQKLTATVSTGPVKVSASNYVLNYYTDAELEASVTGLTAPGRYYVTLAAKANSANICGVSQSFPVDVAPASVMLSSGKFTTAKTLTARLDPPDEVEAIRTLVTKVVVNKVTYQTGGEALDTFLEHFSVTAVDTDGTSLSQAELGRIFLTTGKKTVTIRALEDNPAGLYGEKSFAVTVKGTALNKKWFSVSFPTTGKTTLTTTFTGTAQVPTVTTDLVEEQDYTIRYVSGKTTLSAWQVKNAGTYSLVITGQGRYSGSLTYKFTIGKQDISKAYKAGNLNIAIRDQAVYTPVGTAAAPSVTFTNARGMRLSLVSGTDYTVSYSGNKTVTTKATMTLKGKGNFTGTLTSKTASELIFSIVPKDLSTGGVNVTVTGLTWKKGVVTAVKFTLTHDGKTVSTSQYTTVLGEQDEDTLTLTITGKNKLYTGSLTETVQKDLVKTSDSKKVKISLAKENRYYSGSAIQPIPVITDAQGEDISECFTITYGTNTKVGTGKVIITGRPEMGYYGSKTLTFTILPKWARWIFG